MRTRLVKPGFFTSDTLGELPPLTRILFIGLWCAADREGRLSDKPKQIKTQLLPYDEYDVNEGLEQLRIAGHVLRYQVEGQKVIQVVNFDRHQSLTTQEKTTESVLPEFSIGSESVQNEFRTGLSTIESNGYASSEQVQHQVRPSSTNRIELNGIKQNKIKRAASSTAAATEVFLYWQTVLNHPKAILSDKVSKRIQARLAEGETVERLKSAIDGCKLSPFHMGIDPKNETGTVYDSLGTILRDSDQIEKFVARTLQRQLARGRPTGLVL